jgi:hypothetical protein
MRVLPRAEAAENIFPNRMQTHAMFETILAMCVVSGLAITKVTSTERATPSHVEQLESSGTTDSETVAIALLKDKVDECIEHCSVRDALALKELSADIATMQTSELIVILRKVSVPIQNGLLEIAGILAERPHLAAVAQAELGTKLNAYGYMDPRFYLAKFLPKTNEADPVNSEKVAPSALRLLKQWDAKNPLPAELKNRFFKTNAENNDNT